MVGGSIGVIFNASVTSRALIVSPTVACDKPARVIISPASADMSTFSPKTDTVFYYVNHNQRTSTTTITSETVIANLLIKPLLHYIKDNGKTEQDGLILLGKTDKGIKMNPMTNQVSPKLLLGIALRNHEECYLMVIYCAEIKESIILGLLTSQKVGDNITPKTEDIKKPQMFKALRYPEHIKENSFK